MSVVCDLFFFFFFLVLSYETIEISLGQPSPPSYQLLPPPLCETTTLSRDMIALFDNVQILVINKKLVNKLHSVGFITSLWLGITQWITNKISNFVT